MNEGRDKPLERFGGLQRALVPNNLPRLLRDDSEYDLYAGAPIRLYELVREVRIHSLLTRKHPHSTPLTRLSSPVVLNTISIPSFQNIQ